ncbi:hypothetical protein [Ralstonia phage RpT1]|nr:hypothetical protein [Ralstonia phage RpT1]
MLRTFNAFVARQWNRFTSAVSFIANLPVIFHILVVIVALLIGLGSVVWSVILSTGRVLQALFGLLWAPFKALFVIGSVICDGWTSNGF